MRVYYLCDIKPVAYVCQRNETINEIIEIAYMQD